MKQKCIIVDLDWTLADNRAREDRYIDYENLYGPDDKSNWNGFYHDVILDIPIKEVCDLVRQVSREGVHIFYSTGRRERSRISTKNWLMTRARLPGPDGISTSATLMMRGNSDDRINSEIKQDHLDLVLHHSKPEYQILYALEDDPKAVQMYKDREILVLQVHAVNRPERQLGPGAIKDSGGT